MRKISKNQAKRLAHYKAQIAKDAPVQHCALCKRMGSKLSLDRHHPKRRLKDAFGAENILNYVYLCRPCHDEVEQGKHPHLLERDNSVEKSFHQIKEGENFLKKR